MNLHYICKSINIYYYRRQFFTSVIDYIHHGSLLPGLEKGGIVHFVACH